MDRGLQTYRGHTVYLPRTLTNWWLFTFVLTNHSILYAWMIIALTLSLLSWLMMIYWQIFCFTFLRRLTLITTRYKLALLKYWYMKKVSFVVPLKDPNFLASKTGTQNWLARNKIGTQNGLSEQNVASKIGYQIIFQIANFECSFPFPYPNLTINGG